MIKTINELGFDKNFLDFIGSVENKFNEIAKAEKSNQTMLEWINENIEAVNDENVLNGLTEREKFIFGFCTLCSEILNY